MRGDSAFGTGKQLVGFSAQLPLKKFYRETVQGVLDDRVTAVIGSDWVDVSAGKPSFGPKGQRVLERAADATETSYTILRILKGRRTSV